MNMNRLWILAPLAAAPLLLLQDPQTSDPLERPTVRIDVEYLVAAQGAAEFEAVYTPNIVTMEGQQASVAVENQKAYVSHFEVEYSQDGANAIADPVIDVLHDGHLIEITPHRSVDRTWGGALMFREGSVHSVESVDVRLGSTQVTLQMPNAEVRSRYLPLTPRADGLWMLDLGADDRGQRRMLRVKIVEI